MTALHVTFVVLVYVLSLATAGDKLNPLSDDFINLINLKQNTWKAGRNFPLHTPFSYFKKLMGTFKDDGFLPKIPKVKHDAKLIASLPEAFDPRDKWPNCPSLNEIRDQGACGSCWAVAAVEAMTDRYCIHSKETKQFHFSAEDLMSCCEKCGIGCIGGNRPNVWMYWKKSGIVSGGNYNSSQGCRPYVIPPCEHNITGEYPPCGQIAHTPRCDKTCELNYKVDYDSDKRYAKNVYSVDFNEDQIKAELFKNGPIESALTIYVDFLHYKNGVYNHTEGREIGHHAIKILGWGVEDGHKYWLVANSWNRDWGDKGFFKILRGINHCGIEKTIIAGVPIIV